MIIGTAGHIDHGKTALVKALTGVDGDRLKEEKARGITIDLGFAYLPTLSGFTLGFIDVPGHERFVHTMLAGASGIDFALLTVAASEGVKPQTLEHLAIIDLLGIHRGAIVLTKTDLASPEHIAEVTAKIRSAAKATVLENADILAVSALTGDGIDALRANLVAAAATLRDQRTDDRRFRLAVDRVFTLAGVGVIVTGTVLSGTVHVGDRVEVSPSGIEARVRSLHAQNTPAEVGYAGDRCALNLAGPDIAKNAIHRGDVILNPALQAPTDRIDAVIRLLPDAPKPIAQWHPVRLHHAAAEVGAHIVLLGDKAIEPGTSADVQLVLDRPIAAALQDRYVIRDVSAQRTLGGGRFIDLRPPAHRRRTPERQMQRAAMAVADPKASLAALLDVPPFSADYTAFVRDHSLSTDQADRLVADLGVIILGASPSAVAMSSHRWQLFTTGLMENLAAFHAEHPDLQGIGREKLRTLLKPKLAKAAFVAALQKLSRAGQIALDGAFVRAAGHEVRLTPEDEALWMIIAPLLGGVERFRPPRVRDIANATGRPERDIRRRLKLASRTGFADEVALDHFFLRPTVREMVSIAADVATHAEGGAFTAAQFRDRLANGRKVAIQILEFFDRRGVTMNRDDLRRLNRDHLDLFGPITHLSGETPDEGQGGESSPVGRSDFKSEWGSQPVLGGFDSHSLPPSSSRKKA